MNKKQHIYHQLAESLSTLFLPMAEVALFDANGQIVCIFNRLTSDEIPHVASSTQIKLLINKNQQAKLMVLPLDDGYYLRIIVDTTLFGSLQTFLAHYLDEQAKHHHPTHWQQLVDQLISDYLTEHKTTLGALTAKEKREIILSIHQKDLFRYPDATKYLANKLMVSRATIYNYFQQASQFNSIDIHQVDAFTDEPFSGNPAGVVLNADILSEVMMKKIAREMNLSETSFILNSKKADIKLRYFTPNGAEVKFCGHSTVGALYMLAREKKFGMDTPGHYKLNVEAKIGIIHAMIILDADQSITIQYQMPKTNLLASKLTHLELAKALGIPVNSIDLEQPIMFEKNNQDLYVTINSLEALGKLHIDLKSAKQFAEKHQVVAFVLLSNQTFYEKNHIHMRCFAPLVGIPEDPFTGSVLGGLVEYITNNQLIDTQIETIRVEQGHFISRPGYVELKINHLIKNEPPLVIAKARHFFSTKINL